VKNLKTNIMFTYKIYVGVWNETVERNRSEAIELLSAWSAKLVSIDMKHKPYTKLRTQNKLP
jgi:hypothetical protein